VTNQTPAPGPCPVGDCDWDAENTLDEHLYVHDYNELRPAVVRLALENDRLRAELGDADKPGVSARYWPGFAEQAAVEAIDAQLRAARARHARQASYVARLEALRATRTQES